ncbi:MAG: hypothetical protein A3I68_02470 [Candidatus Melainabacteria bacterium RIFCSPLOWO2_02_FULL_35_15]|nr:MAG: hypothetical protein A3F80_00390 [Candidatus Melainabacteria bacterium RIFCSPLOWO2_12_FULL_35_11]OGI13271.1 MAG: hypothetical protein A3I68_02470 [Candidatus Melainabacteria bacterium RIFCSPLOWO2_02_FULL_35_15]
MNTEIFVLHETDDILQASNFMKKERIRNLPVVDERNKLIGLVTLREIVDALANGKKNITIGDIMIREVKAIGPDTPLKGAIEVMIINKFGSMPVVDSNRKLLGMISELDLLKKLYSMSDMPDDFYRAEEKKKSFQF